MDDHSVTSLHTCEWVIFLHAIIAITVQLSFNFESDNIEHCVLGMDFWDIHKTEHLPLYLDNVHWLQEENTGALFLDKSILRSDSSRAH